MRTISKAALASLMVLGAGVATAVPAEARIGVAVNLGVFAPAIPVVPAPVYVRPGYCYGPYYYADCGYRAYGEPVFWNGYWYPNPAYRIVRGRREFWISGGWREARLREHFRR